MSENNTNSLIETSRTREIKVRDSNPSYFNINEND